MDTNSETPRTNRTLVLALGNTIMNDDGVGLAALRRFTAAYALPDTVDTLDGGTLGLDLLYYIEGYPRVLVVDCVQTGRDVGAVCRIDGAEVEGAFERCLSPHQMGLRDLVSVLRLQGRMPEAFTVVGLEGTNIDIGETLTPAVDAALPEAVETMAAVLRGWGVPLQPNA